MTLAVGTTELETANRLAAVQRQETILYRCKSKLGRQTHIPGLTQDWLENLWAFTITAMQESLPNLWYLHPNDTFDHLQALVWVVPIGTNLHLIAN